MVKVWTMNEPIFLLTNAVLQSFAHALLVTQILNSKIEPSSSGRCFKDQPRVATAL